MDQRPVQLGLGQLQDTVRHGLEALQAALRGGQTAPGLLDPLLRPHDHGISGGHPPADRQGQGMVMSPHTTGVN